MTDFADNWWQQLSSCRDAADWFGSHLVGLFINYDSGDGPQYSVYTGFLLNSEATLLWLAAGHIVDKISSLLSDPDVNIGMMRWLDGYDTTRTKSISVRNRDLKMFSASDNSIDFGSIVIVIDDGEKLIGKNGMRIMTGHAWKKLHLAKPEGFYILGLPYDQGEYIQETFSGNQGMRLFRDRLTCRPVRRIVYQEPAGGDDYFWKDPEAFYGEILPFADGAAHPSDEFSGMSGGPLISVERDASGKVQYRLFGIQQGLLTSPRLIRAEPVNKLIKFIF